MTRRTIDIDDEALEGAKAWMGTKTITETVNEALRDMAKNPDRLALIQYWLSDPFQEIGELQEMKEAWRKDKYSLLTKARSIEQESSK